MQRVGQRAGAPGAAAARQACPSGPEGRFRGVFHLSLQFSETERVRALWRSTEQRRVHIHTGSADFSWRVAALMLYLNHAERNSTRR